MNEFDALVAELRLGQAVRGLRPDQLRAVEAMIVKSASSALLNENDDDDDEEIHIAAQEGQLRSDAEAASLDGKPRKKKPAPELMAKARTAAPISTAQLLAAAAEVKAASAHMVAEMASTHRKFACDQVRERSRAVLAKALALFHEGKITATQVSTIEAGAHAIDNAAASMERGA